MKNFYFYLNLPDVIFAETEEDAFEKLEIYLDRNMEAILTPDNWSIDYDLDEE